MSTNQNFLCVDQQKLPGVSTTSSSGHFTAIALTPDTNFARIQNRGVNDALVSFGVGSATAVKTAPYGAQYLAAAGADIIVRKGAADYFAAITEAGMTDLWFEAGYGN